MPAFSNRFARLCFFLLVFSVLTFRVMAQSPDTRVCNCLSSALDENFMDATKATFGRLGLLVHREEELHPAQNQKVHFELPVMRPKSGCGAVYRIVILDKNGLIIFEEQDSQPKFSYTFEECGSRYDVTVSVAVSSPNGGDGNCSRTRHFYVRPLCNNNDCACDPPATGGKNTGVSRNVGFEATLTCGVVTATRRTYNFQYKITNKTNCRMEIESVTVLGETISGTTALPAGVSTSRFSTAISMPLSTAAPGTGSVNVLVRYKVNGRSCSATIKIPYIACSR